MTIQDSRSLGLQETNGHTHQESVLSVLARHDASRPAFTLTAEDVSALHLATSCYLTELGPPPSPELIKAVIGMANGSDDWFECPDIKLAKIYNSDAKETSLKKRVARDRDKLFAWQKENKIEILECIQGDQIRDKATGKLTNHPTQWRCRHVLTILRILEEASLESTYLRHPDQTIGRLAAEIGREERMKFAAPGKRLRRPKYVPGFDQFVKTIQGFIRKCLTLKEDPDQARLEVMAGIWATLSEGSTLSLEQAVEYIRKTQVVDSKESAPVDIMSPPPPRSANFVPLNKNKKGDKIDQVAAEEEEPQEGGVEFGGDSVIAVPSNSQVPEPEKLSPVNQAIQALQVFISRGYHHFFLRLENESRDTVRHQTLTAVAALAALGEWIVTGDKRRASVQVRPQEEGDELAIRPRPIHLDDLGPERFEKIRPYGALGFETSPDRFQVFCFVTANKQVADEIGSRLRRGMHSDRGANGAFRLPGSRNWKRTRGGCAVKLHFATFNDSFTPDELEASGLLAEPEVKPSPQPQPRRATPTSGQAPFPDYQRCIDEAPRKDGKIDYSHADLAWANICRARGIPEDATYAKLEELREAIDGKPSKHPDRGPGSKRGYVRRTIDRAYE